MRVLSGSLKGRQLKFPKNIRPTQNKVRKATFDCLGDFVKDSHFLELFAGSGAVGIEAFSYGAKEVSFVEDNLQCLKLIEENLKSLAIPKKGEAKVFGSRIFYQIYRKDSLECIAFLGKHNISFDIIFLDPPYGQGLSKKSLISLFHYDILKIQGILVIEHHKKEELPATQGVLSIFKQKIYGQTMLSFYKRGE